MIRRLLSVVLLAWILGFAWFALTLPLPLPPGPASRTDAIVVLTGGPGRIERGLDRLAAGEAERLFISGVGPDVTKDDLSVRHPAAASLMDCCVALGFEAADTRGNADEVARWLRLRGYRTVRLVTTDWHMRRAMFEMRRALPSTIVIRPDAVRSRPELATLWREYHKYLLGAAGRLVGL